jgi:CRISPR type III-A-associated RAMP protein Csm4
MGLKKIVLSPRSPFSSLFTADQIWGHMAWAISEMDGTDAASSFVASFEKDPPFLVSAMMPEGFLPKPCMGPIVKDAATSQEEKTGRVLAKRNKSKKWLSIKDFISLQKDKAFMTKGELSDHPEIYDIKETHVSIDYSTGQAIDGGLFNASYKSSSSDLCFLVDFIENEKSNQELADRIARHWEKTGLGGDRNVGRGSFSIRMEDLDTAEKEAFSFRSSAFMTLSRCFGDDLVPVNYTVTVYAGITGKSEASEAGMFNKQPIIGFEPGSVFTSGKGCLAHGVNPDKRICSYGYAFPIGFDA